MKIINAGYEIITPIDGDAILKRIEQCGRVCYKSEDKITEDSAKKFCANVIKRGHEAVLEHCSFTVKFIVDRGVSHEIVRHRIASYCQESTRYVSYSKKANTINTEEDVLYSYCKVGLSMKKIADKSNGKYTEWDIYKILNNNCIKRRNFGSRGLLNDNYFKEIDTPEKAYLLGFIMADGSIRKDLSQLTISQKDEESWWILNMIRDFIQPDAKSLNIHNNNICVDLFNKGIVPNKTYDITEENVNNLWESVPNKLKFDFIRGLLDGDGSIRWFYQKDNSKTISCHIEFIGNKHLINKIALFINNKFNYNASVKQDSISKVLYRYIITNSQVGKQLCELMYKNFKFPYGHSKTARYYEAFNLEIPYNIGQIIPKDFNVIIPKYEVNGGKNGLSGKQLWIWGDAMLHSEIAYKNMLELGATPQEARSILPNSLKTELVMTANIREWRNFFKLRTEQAAHPQMREVTEPLLKELQSKIPILFDDIIPYERKVD